MPEFATASERASDVRQPREVAEKALLAAIDAHCDGEARAELRRLAERASVTAWQHGTSQPVA